MPALELVPLGSIVPTPYYIERSGPSERSLSYPVRAPLFYRAHASQYTISLPHRPVSPPSLAVLLFRRTMTTGAAEARARARARECTSETAGVSEKKITLARSRGLIACLVRACDRRQRRPARCQQRKRAENPKKKPRPRRGALENTPRLRYRKKFPRPALRK